MKANSALSATGLVVFALLASGGPHLQIVEATQTGGAGIVLPPGVKRITFGQAVTTKNARGGLECSIPQPLPEPVTFSGVSTISYVIEVDPQIVPALTAAIVGDFGDAKEVRGEGCARFAVCAGRVCQPQYGRTYSRGDGAPIKSGAFTLEVQVGVTR